jgi:hypothetical protein
MDRVTNTLLLQKLEDNQQFMKETMTEIKQEMSSMRKDWNEKYEKRMVACSLCKEELNAKISRVDQKILGIRIVSLGASAVAGCVGGFFGAMFEIARRLK